MKLLQRFAEKHVRESLEDFRVTAVTGGRQTGKSTLCQLICNDLGGTSRSLDEQRVVQADNFDAEAFIESEKLQYIDEIQRAPFLLNQIKYRVDKRPDCGQFLISGSAQIAKLKSIPDALTGRVQYINMWPLTQLEIEKRPINNVIGWIKKGCPRVTSNTHVRNHETRYINESSKVVFLK